MLDLCIRCGKETKYSKSTPVEKRYCYVDGTGQLCEACYREVYKVSPDEAKLEERDE